MYQTLRYSASKLSLKAINRKKEFKSKLASQKKEMEGIIKRHLGFIDKLIVEKEELSKRCETLSDEVKAMDKAFKEKVEIRKGRRTLAAVVLIRRILDKGARRTAFKGVGTSTGVMAGGRENQAG
jgi:ABC-type phosphate transport system auxiliary subunit